MKVLMISGDRKISQEGTQAHARLELQRSVVDELVTVFWGRGNIVPHIPEGNFDVVTVQDPFWRGIVAWVISRRIGARYNVQIHTNLAEQSFIRRAIAHFVLKRADSIRVVSEELKRFIIGHGVTAPITVLPIYVDIPTFTSVRRHEHQGKHIVWIGRFEEEKNPLAAIDVLKEVRTAIPDVRLTMVGEGSLSRALSDAAADLPVEIPGWSDPRDFLKIADVVLCTSWYEGYGASIAEALAAGCPVVAPDVGVAKDMGALVVPRAELAPTVVRALKEGASGVLNPDFIVSKEKWAERWRASLE